VKISLTSIDLLFRQDLPMRESHYVAKRLRAGLLTSPALSFATTNPIGYGGGLLRFLVEKPKGYYEVMCATFKLIKPIKAD
jgi:hypothetical protein